MGTKTRDGSAVIGSLVGVALCRMGLMDVQRLIANADLSDERLRGVIGACRDGESSAELTRAVWAL